MNKSKSKYQSEEQNEIKSFFIMLIVVILIIFVVYFLSKNFLEDDASLYTISYTTGSYNEDVVIAGTMLNRDEKEYYVIAYDSTSTQSVYVTTIASLYRTTQTDALAIYELDLDNYLNKDVVASDENPFNSSAKTTADLYVIDYTLMRVKNGKIVEYITGEENITAALEVTDPIEETT